MSEPLLSVNDLSVWFETAAGHVQAVRGVSFEICKGEVVSVVGESGSGKSAIALSIMGLLPRTARTAGTALFVGTDLLNASKRELSARRGNEIAMIFQDPMTALNPLMTVGHQIAEAIVTHQRIRRDAAGKRAVQLMARVGIPEASRRAEQYPHEFSGGMCQRAMIAMAIANEPKLLIADEPTTALDVTVQAQVIEVMREVRELTGAAMLLITHDLGLVAGSADRVLVMYAGRIFERGPVNDIFFHTRNPYTRGLLRSIPHRGVAGGSLRTIPGSPPSLLDTPPGCPFRPRCADAVDLCSHDVPALVAVNEADQHASRCYRASELPRWSLEDETR